MRIGAYQFSVTSDVNSNFNKIEYTLSVNTISPFQTAPTILYDRSGQVLNELAGNEEGLLVYDLEKEEIDFGEAGRKEVTDWLLANSALYKNSI